MCVCVCAFQHKILAGEREERIRNVPESQWMCAWMFCVRVEFSSSENPFVCGIFLFFLADSPAPQRFLLFASHFFMCSPSVRPSFLPSTGSFIYYSCCSYFFLFASQSRLPSSPSRSFFFFSVKFCIQTLLYSSSRDGALSLFFVLLFSFCPLSLSLYLSPSPSSIVNTPTTTPASFTSAF